ncbi:hypothetical protein CEXT_375681 [Caerostris extrusa]|uniref:Uncharacterized protein n=1 Tax=Caerostris extrusa TaxID=172846 RepID=A0AAV4SXG9_CAEEX|nr:hypothetical protein CEXT_375681 [Caerostris extrusa]
MLESNNSLQNIYGLTFYSVFCEVRTSAEECTFAPAPELPGILLQFVTKGKDLALVTTRLELLHVCKILKGERFVR